MGLYRRNWSANANKIWAFCLPLPKAEGKKKGPAMDGHKKRRPEGIFRAGAIFTAGSNSQSIPLAEALLAKALLPSPPGAAPAGVAPGLLDDQQDDDQGREHTDDQQGALQEGKGGALPGGILR